MIANKVIDYIYENEIDLIKEIETYEEQLLDIKCKIQELKDKIKLINHYSLNKKNDYEKKVFETIIKTYPEITSPLEVELIEKILKGLSCEEISNELYRTSFAIKHRKTILFKKIKVKSTSELLSRMGQHNG